MPTIRLPATPDSFTKTEKASIIEALTDGLNGVAVASGNGDIKQYVSCQIEESAEGGHAIGGRILA